MDQSEVCRRREAGLETVKVSRKSKDVFLFDVIENRREIFLESEDTEDELVPVPNLFGRPESR